MNLKEITWKDFKNYWVNDGIKWLWIALWIGGNLAVFLERFFHYRNNVPLFDIVGNSVPLARGSAASIKLNCALILVLVLRNFLSYIRTTWVNIVFPIDKNIVFHRYIAWTILIMTFIHVFAHYENFNRQSQATGAQLITLGYLNNSAPTVAHQAWATQAGWSGHVVCVIMVFMFTAATKRVRSTMFEVFWYTHHMFFAFYVLLCIHGIPGKLEKPTFWAWVIGPLFLYLCERSLRAYRAKKDTILLKAIQHPSRVLELQMETAGFNYKPGQYLFLQCAWIGSYEWHPFTITSCPQEPHVSVHIRQVGDWTNALTAYLNKDKAVGIVQENILTSPDGKPILCIDGPFGAAAEEVFQFQTVMLIAAGIGVTPYASILKSVLHNFKSGTVMKLTRVHFYWISPDKNSFDWFKELLKELEREDVENRLQFNIYFTGALSTDEIRNMMYSEQNNEGGDQVTGLVSRTQVGRPKWNDIFKGIAAEHLNENVGVFFCGPPALSKQLYKHCVNNTIASSTKFHYKKENF